MIKVMTIVGTRPEIIKLSRVIPELDKHMDHTLVHTGQNYDYELNEIFFKDLGIRKPDFFLEAAGASPAETIGNVIVRSDAILAQVKPEALLLYGDTNSCLAVISAKKRRVPVFHMEAGNRCFDQRVPEEINRKIVDHLSDINMPLTEHARRYLLAEGIRPETIIKTGSCMREVLTYHDRAIRGSDILQRLNLVERGFFIVSAHREENIDSPENFTDLIETLNATAAAHNKPVILSAHPRTLKRLKETEGLTLHKLVSVMKPLGFFDYIKMQMTAYCVISDSGTLTEESSLLGFPGVMIRQAHERPEGMDEGTVVMSGLKSQRVLESIQLVTSAAEPRIRPVVDYEVDNVSVKVARIIQSYVDYINRTTWHVE